MLAGVVGVSFVGRVVYVFVGAPAKLVFSDALYYHLQGNLLANGHFFVKPFENKRFLSVVRNAFE